MDERVMTRQTYRGSEIKKREKRASTDEGQSRLEGQRYERLSAQATQVT